MSLDALVAGVLALAALLGVAGRLRWRSRAPVDRRPAPLRMAWLLLAPALSAALLYFALLPPRTGGGTGGTLVVLTADAVPAQLTPARERGPVVALPEAPPLASQAEPVPDLATALRRHPEAAALHVLGSGLEARDREAAGGLAIEFDPAPEAPGLLELNAAQALAPGAAWHIAGRARGAARVELLDPGAQTVAAAQPDDQGRFSLEAAARGAGLAEFSLRVQGDGGSTIEQAALPLASAAPPPLRVLVQAGAPGPETKYLRRWAEDAGLQLRTRISLGGGIGLGDAFALDAATLQGADLVVLDERSFAALAAAERAALRRAVEQGLGLLLRLDADPLPAARSLLRDWGLPAAADAATGDAAALLHDGDPPLGLWRALGRGRVGLWPVQDSWQWVLAGDAGRHGDAWSRAFATLARPGPDAPARIEGGRVGERSVVCPASEGATVASPSGTRFTLLPDARTGTPACAAWWPQQAGWHALEQGGRRQPFYVRAADDAPGLARAEREQATRALAGGSAREPGSVSPAAAPPTPGPRGPAWPWWLAWLLCSAALWWSERRLRH